MLRTARGADAGKTGWRCERRRLERTLRFLFASQPELMSRVLGIVYRVIESHLIQ